jgi:hypothetical protein
MKYVQRIVLQPATVWSLTDIYNFSAISCVQYELWLLRTVPVQDEFRFRPTIIIFMQLPENNSILG